MKQNNIKTLLALFIAVTVFASSCQKDSGVDSLNTGKASVTISMKGVGIANGNSLKAGLRASTSSGKSVATPAVQRQVVKFNDQFNVTATLKEVTPTAPALRASANAKRAEVTATGEGDVLPLADGTAYTIVISQGDEVVTTETFTQGAGEHTFDIDAGNYTYVAYAYGDASATGADQDPLWVSGDFNATDGANTVEIVLEHQLTEVTVVFNAGAGREITAITAGTLAPNHDYTFNEETGIVDFGAATTAASISFAGQTAGQTWTSAPAMIAVEDTDNGTVELTGVTINGIDGAVSSDGWALRAGVQYTLELNLGDKEEEGFEIGGFIWAPGNLVYNDGSYGFAAPTEQGDFWYFNWPLPVGEGTTPSIADMPEYDVNRDPCTLVPGGEWYTPSSEEYETLIATPGAATDWQYHYGGTSTGDQGVFYGTDDLQLASENSADYLFFPGNGSSGNAKYWTYNSENTSNAASIQFGGYNKPNTVGFSEQKSSADIKIRCVKNAN